MKNTDNNRLPWYRSIAFTFIFIVIVIITVITTIVSVTTIKRQTSVLLENAVDKTRTLGHYIALVVPEDILAYDFEALDKYMQDLTLEKDIIYSVIESNDGRNLTSYINYDDPYIQKSVVDSGTNNILAVVKHINRKFKVIPLEFPIIFNNTVYGKLLIGLNKTRINQRGDENLYSFITYAVGIGVLLSIAIYLVFVFQAVKPLKRLLLGFDKIGEGNIEYKVPVYSKMNLEC